MPAILLRTAVALLFKCRHERADDSLSLQFPNVLNFPTSFRLTVTWIVLAAAGADAADAVNIAVDVAQDRVTVSPYIYGKNDSVGSPTSPQSAAGFQLFRDAGVKMLRMHGGNNGTKYNWQKKLTSHPDWYNNVYGSDWDYSQTMLQQNLPGVQSMWCFQLIGKVANTGDNNFNDWGYNRSQWWSGVGQNLAGGGVPNSAGGNKASKEGNPALYLVDQTADTSTGLIEHWDKLGLDRSQFLYWNMDNEPEIWEGTHDDVMPVQISAEAFMQRYFDYAKKARARFPNIKLAGPVPANEWQWYNWSTPIRVDGRSYPWLEYFIKRVGEEQKRTGVRLLDVLDIHYYPSTKDPAALVQLHRTYFDRTYANPEANGVYTINGGWDTSIKQEYIFGRCQEWLATYLGPGHGVTLGVTETGIQLTNAPVASVWYASTLGEFLKNGVEVFTPWSWQPGMWEVLHLFSRYNGPTSVRAVSSDETTVSAYATVDDATGNLAVVLVNRALTTSMAVNVSLANTQIPDGSYSRLQLANLPAQETFVTHTNNALATGTVTVAGNAFSLTLPALSVTSVQLTRSSNPPTPPPTTEPTPGTSRLVNVSVRAKSGTGANALIVGFVIGGSGSKPLLLRGVGPTLKRLGVSAVLANPVMRLVSQSTGTLTSNDDWGSSAAQISTASVQLGAFALDSGSVDSALFTTLSTGAYTALIEGKTGESGIALGEAYDADVSGSARFINVAARTWVGVDAECLIAGFVVRGDGTKRVLIRAVGPGLARFDVPGLLNDPIVKLYGQEGTPLRENNDWGANGAAVQIEAAGSKVGAFTLPAGSKDAALVVDLPQGSYTAIVTGVNNTTGVALIEVYEIE